MAHWEILPYCHILGYLLVRTGFHVNVHLEILILPQKTPPLFVNCFMILISLHQQDLKHKDKFI